MNIIKYIRVRIEKKLEDRYNHKRNEALKIITSDKQTVNKRWYTLHRYKIYLTANEFHIYREYLKLL